MHGAHFSQECDTVIAIADCYQLLTRLFFTMAT